MNDFSFRKFWAGNLTTDVPYPTDHLIKIKMGPENRSSATMGQYAIVPRSSSSFFALAAQLFNP
jgi:hypothetical protein